MGKTSAALDAAVTAATLKQFGDDLTENFDYDVVPTTEAADIKHRNGKPVERVKGKISTHAKNIECPTFIHLKNRRSFPDFELFYAGAHVYGIVEFVARESSDKRYLNARISGILHIRHGTPLEWTNVTLARPEDFEFEAA